MIEQQLLKIILLDFINLKEYWKKDLVEDPKLKPRNQTIEFGNLVICSIRMKYSNISNFKGMRGKRLRNKMFSQKGGGGG